jgi:hypothetical protein
MIYVGATLSINSLFFERRKLCRQKLKTKSILAWRLLSNSCAKLIELLKNIILSKDFVIRHRNSPKDFTRQRKLPFHTLVVFLLNFIKGSYQDELDNFYKALNHWQVAKRFVSKVALTKARMKLKYEAFIELNHHLIDFFYRRFQPLTWNGFNLLAVDGSTVRLPRIKEIAQHFGAWHPRQGKECPMARVSQLYDVLNRICIHAIVSPKSIGERELAAQHFLNILPEDLILLDRGYPAYWLFNLILALESQFCARISCTQWKIIRKFYKSGKREKVIWMRPSPGTTKQCQEMGLDSKPLRLRLIRIELDTGEVEILVTSLIDKDLYPFHIFSELYHDRWPVEEDYKTMKCWIEVENFSGKSVLSVYQDFHAKVFSKNLTSALAHPAQKMVTEANEGKKYAYRINFAQALSKTKGVIALLFNRSKHTVIRLISQLHEVFRKTIEPIRPGRKFPRKHKIRRRSFYSCYKPIC